MDKLRFDDILDVDTYEAVRTEYRARVIDHKGSRRVAIGDKVTVVFEDRETLRYQIQEMTRIEQIREPAKVQDEIDAYNALMPGAHELSATLFIEIPDLARVKTELDRLVGIDECVTLEIADPAGGEAASVKAQFDEGQMEEERISAVQYVRFSLTPEQVARFARAKTLRLRIDHANYRHATDLSEPTRESLRRDLEGPPVLLLDVDAARSIALPEDEIVETGEAVRVRKPHRKLAPSHWIVESIDPGVRFEDAEDRVLVELLRTARAVAARVAAAGGRARIVTEVSGDAGAVAERAALHVLAGRMAAGT